MNATPQSMPMETKSGDYLDLKDAFGEFMTTFEVFKEANVLYNVGVFRSRSDKYIFIADDGFTSSEWRAIATANPTVAPRVIAARRPNVEYSVEHGGQKITSPGPVRCGARCAGPISTAFPAANG